MENKKLDRLFQDKLVRYETPPSGEAWNQISSELNHKKRPVIWMRVAAAILILVVSAVVYIQLNEEPTRAGEVAYITHPTPIDPPVLMLPKFEKVEAAQVQKKSIPVKTQSRNQFAVVERMPETEVVEILEAREVESIESFALIEMPEPEIVEEVDEMALLPQLSVQITYIASHKVPADSTITDDKTKMGKLLAKAREISPGDMIASIRETKNNFINGINN